MLYPDYYIVKLRSKERERERDKRSLEKKCTGARFVLECTVERKPKEEAAVQNFAGRQASFLASPCREILERTGCCVEEHQKYRREIAVERERERDSRFAGR